MKSETKRKIAKFAAAGAISTMLVFGAPIISKINEAQSVAKRQEEFKQSGKEKIKEFGEKVVEREIKPWEEFLGEVKKEEKGRKEKRKNFLIGLGVLAGILVAGIIVKSITRREKHNGETTNLG